MSPRTSSTLPSRNGPTAFVTDGGLETDLIFHHGVELPDFAAFPLLDSDDGRAHLTTYFDSYADVASQADAGLILETPTWRANTDWGYDWGYGPGDLGRVNRDAVDLLHALRTRYAADLGVAPILVCGAVGPRGDGYRSDNDVESDRAADYHRPQLDAFAAAGADLATAYTMTTTAEAIGIVKAARSVQLPIAVSFTVETDGRLPDETPLGDAISMVDDEAAPEYYLVNCAHPLHVLRAFDRPGAWTERIVGTRANASTQSHAELDEAEQLDEGDPAELAAAQRKVASVLPGLGIVGGCCGTDSRHVAAMWGVEVPTTHAG